MGILRVADSIQTFGALPDAPRRPSGLREFLAAIRWPLLLALALRAIVGLRIDPVANDSAMYFEMADRFLDGRWRAALAYDYPPLYPLLIAGVRSIGGTAATAGVLIALAADLLVLFPLASIAFTVAGPGAAWGAAFLWAIHPYAVRLGVQALTDAPAAFLVVTAVWMGLRALEDGRVAWAVMAGAASGLAYLARPEGIEPALILAALCALASPVPFAIFNRLGPASGGAGAAPAGLSTTPSAQPDAAPRRAMRWAGWTLAPLAGFALLASPYIGYISGQAGSLTFSKKKSPAVLVMALASPSLEDPGERAAFMIPPRSAEAACASGSPSAPPGPKGSASRDGAAPAPQSWPRRVAHNVYLFQKPLVNGVHPVVLCFGLLAAWGIWAYKPAGSRRARAFLIGLLGLHFAVLLGLAAAHPGYLGGRYFFLVTLYAMPFAGAGLAWTLTWGAERLHAARWLPVVVLGLLVALTIRQTAFRQDNWGSATHPAAAWIRAQVSGTPVVVTPVAKLTYHAGAQRVDFHGTYHGILARGRAQGAQFVAFYPYMLKWFSPDFLCKIDPADLELVRTFPEPTRLEPNRRFEVYRLRPR